MNAENRFWGFVHKTDDCWRWIGYVDPKGYGRFSVNGSVVYAHVWSYKTFMGEIPAGLQIDHLCRNRSCVRPDHLEAVTCKENLRRGGHNHHNHKKTHCPQGHPYDERNTYRHPNGGRRCKACRREQARLIRERKKQSERGNSR